LQAIDYKRKKREATDAVRDFPLFTAAFDLQGANVLGLEALGTPSYREFHCLAFCQAAEAFRLNRLVVDEHILTVRTADESVSLGVVEPLYRSLFH